MRDRSAMTAFNARALATVAGRCRADPAALGWARSVGLEAVLTGSSAFKVRELRLGTLRLDWTALERTAAYGPVSAELCVATGMVGCDRPFAHWSEPPNSGSHVLVVPDILAFLAIAQAKGRESIFPFVMVAPVGRTLPPDWGDGRYWEFERVTILSDTMSSPSALVPLLAAQGLPNVGVATPPGGGSWRSWATRIGRLGYEEIRTIETRALHVSSFGGLIVDAQETRDQLTAGCRVLDDEGRLARLIRVDWPRFDGATPASRDVVVRSDRSCAEVVAGRAFRRSTTGNAITGSSHSPNCRWRADAAAAFIDGARMPTAPEVGARLHDLVMPLLDDPHRTQLLSSYVALTYLFPAFESLPLLLIRGGDAAARLSLRRLLSAICYEPVVVTRNRAMQLARVADAGSGVVLLDEPGPLTGPSGPTEVGRFLENGLIRDASPYATVSHRRGLRTLDVFGPKIAIMDRGSVAGLACASITVDLPLGGSEPCYARLDRDGDEARAALYQWSMGASARLHAIAGCLSPERILPTIARELFGEAGMATRPASPGVALQASPIEEASSSPPEVMQDVMSRCGSGGYLALVEVMLEIALRDGDQSSLSPERVGRWIASHTSVDTDRPTERRRLFGQISRIYPLTTSNPRSADPAAAFAFCVRRTCGECRYDSICGATFPNLRRRKLAVGVSR